MNENWPGSRGANHVARSRAVLTELLDALTDSRPSRLGPLLKRARPYAVALFDREFAAVKARGLVSELAGDLWEWKGRYDRVRGLTAEVDLDVLVV